MAERVARTHGVRVEILLSPIRGTRDLITLGPERLAGS